MRLAYPSARKPDKGNRTMPIQSKAQRRKFAELLVEGKITPEVFEEWNRGAGSKELPERLHPKEVEKPKRKAKAKTKAKTKARATRAAKKGRPRRKAVAPRKVARKKT
jgi:hypothetical protein